MNRLKSDRQEMVLNLLVEGNSIRAAERITGVHRDTIMRLMAKVADNCDKYSADKLTGITCQHIECDEIWTYVAKKQKRINGADNPQLVGDQYVFVAIDRDTKLIPAFRVGKRDSMTTYFFLHELSNIVDGRFQLTTDQWQSYRDLVGSVFGDRVDYAMLRKIYHGDGSGREGYSPARLKGTKPRIIQGNPDREKICTSYIERQNLTIRTQCKRFTRLTNAFSKKLTNLKAALSLHFWHYNFARQHQSLRMTPAMAAGVATMPCGWRDVL